MNLPRLSLLLLPIVCASCSTTKMTDTWQEPEFKRASMKDVLVVAVDSNVSNRTLFETQFVAELERNNIKATASFAELGTELPSKESVKAYLEKSKHDHIIVTALSNIDIETDYVPASVQTYYTGPYYPYYGAYWNSGSTVTMTRDAYVDTQTNVILSTTIYDTSTEKPVWMGRSKTYEVGSISYVADELAMQMIRKIND